MRSRRKFRSNTKRKPLTTVAHGLSTVQTHKHTHTYTYVDESTYVYIDQRRSLWALFMVRTWIMDLEYSVCVWATSAPWIMLDCVGTRGEAGGSIWIAKRQFWHLRIITIWIWIYRFANETILGEGMQCPRASIWTCAGCVQAIVISLANILSGKERQTDSGTEREREKE